MTAVKMLSMHKFTFPSLAFTSIDGDVAPCDMALNEPFPTSDRAPATLDSAISVFGELAPVDGALGNEPVLDLTAILFDTSLVDARGFRIQAYRRIHREQQSDAGSS